MRQLGIWSTVGATFYTTLEAKSGHSSGQLSSPYCLEIVQQGTHQADTPSKKPNYAPTPLPLNQQGTHG